MKKKICKKNALFEVNYNFRYECLSNFNAKLINYSSCVRFEDLIIVIVDILLFVQDA